MCNPWEEPPRAWGGLQLRAAYGGRFPMHGTVLAGFVAIFLKKKKNRRNLPSWSCIRPRRLFLSKAKRVLPTRINRGKSHALLCLNRRPGTSGAFPFLFRILGTYHRRYVTPIAAHYGGCCPELMRCCPLLLSFVCVHDGLRHASGTSSRDQVEEHSTVAISVRHSVVQSPRPFVLKAPPAA